MKEKSPPHKEEVEQENDTIMHPEPIKEYSPEVKKEDSSQKLRLEASDDSPSSPDNKDSPPPVEPITKLESEPVPPKEEEPPVETPVKKSILDVEESEQPPKPLHLMTSAEKTMWDLELKYKEMKRQMEMQQRLMEQEFEMKKKEALRLKEEEERRERERLEKIRLEKERQERLERERLERERLEKERLERERIERERLEKERLEKERIERERQERLERERLEKLRIMRENEQRERDDMAIEEAHMRQFLHEEYEREEELKLQRQIEETKREIERQQQAELERKRQEEEEQRRRECERKAKLSQDRVTQEAVEAEKQRRIAEMKMMAQQQMSQKQSLDWEEGQQNDDDETPSSSSEDEITKELNQQRESYVNNMTQKYGKVLDQEIRRMETKDMTRRKIKKADNEDKLYDFIKIKEIKQEKIEQQRRQLQESSSSQPSKESKESEKAPVVQQPEEESSERLSSSNKSEGEVFDDNQLDAYDLFDKNDEFNNQIPHEIESIQEIMPSSLESPKSTKQIQTYDEPPVVQQSQPAADPTQAQDQIQALQAQIAMLSQQLGQAFQSIKQLSSQTNIKQGPTQKPAESVLEEQEDDYHLPAFGSQVQQEKLPAQSSPSKKNVEPFQLGVGQKRNFSQAEQDQQYQDYAEEYQNSPKKKAKYKNLAEYVQQCQMDYQKQSIQELHQQREQYQRQRREQQRQNGQQKLQGGSQGPSGQHMHSGRQRSSSRDTRSIQGQYQQPSNGQMRHRPPHPQGPPRVTNGPPRASQHQGQPQVRQRSGSPTKQFHQVNQGMNVAGSRRYVHSQNPNPKVMSKPHGQQDYKEAIRQKMQQSPSQSQQINNGELKRQKIVHIEDDE